MQFGSDQPSIVVRQPDHCHHGDAVHRRRLGRNAAPLPAVRRQSAADRRRQSPDPESRHRRGESDDDGGPQRTQVQRVDVDVEADRREDDRVEQQKRRRCGLPLPFL